MSQVTEASQTPGPAESRPANGGPKTKARTPLAQATPDLEALGGLLDRVGQDQAAMQRLLAGRPSLDQLDAEELAKAKTILADRDSAEQLLQARLQDAPLPRPQATPTSAPPLATPTPIP